MNHKGTFSTDSLTPRYPEPVTVSDTGPLWVIVQGTGVGVTTGDESHISLDADPVSAGCRVERLQYLGHRGEIPCYAAEIAADSPFPEGMEYSDVRELYGRIPEDELAIAALAVQIIDFDRTTAYCGRCGAKTRQLSTERAKVCPACTLITYPRLSPAIIVLVRNGDTILLARSPRFPPGVHSVIAGFVEPGEQLEHAVCREVREETGISVENIRYFGSEPWPFPHSLMIGFIADYAGGALAIDNHEIEAAGWFDRDHLPPLPSRMSLSRALIDWWLRGAGGQEM
jgi:NAD+ diphosphatase